MIYEKVYTIKLNKSQLETLSAATEVLARLGVGQFDYAFDWLPFAKGKYITHEDQLYFSERLAPLMVHNIDGYRSSLGINCNETPEFSKIAWDLYQVIRHRLSWERAVEEGIVTSLDDTRKWPEMMTVDYDTPFHASEEPLAEIE